MAETTKLNSKDPWSGFIRLERAFVRGEWQTLSPGARCLLIEIWCLYNGKNNGSITYSIRQAEQALNCGRRTAIRWFSELRDAGLIEATQRGGFLRTELAAIVLSSSAAATASRTCSRVGTS
jgi:hypothetical protein